MNELSASAWLQVVAVPLLLMLIGVIARRLGRRDGDDSPRENDWAVGTTTLLMLLGTIFADLRVFKDITEPVIWLVGVLFSAFLSLDHDRFRSWKRDDNGIPQNQKRPLVGIILPDLLCLAIFGLYQARKVHLI